VFVLEVYGRRKRMREVEEKAEVIVAVGHPSVHWLKYLLLGFEVNVLAESVMSHSAAILVLSFIYILFEVRFLYSLNFDLEVIDVDTA